MTLPYFFPCAIRVLFDERRPSISTIRPFVSTYHRLGLSPPLVAGATKDLPPAELTVQSF